MRKYFNHSHVRTLVGVFGHVFNDIYIARHNKTGDKIDTLIHVPIRYLPMSHNNLGAASDDDVKKFVEFYPRMTFDFLGLTYDSTKQRPQSQMFHSSKNRSQFGFSPAPYDLSFVLHIVSREQFSALQIIEQIIPYFRPNLTVSIKHEVFDNHERDVIINLNSVALEDNYTEIDDNRVVHYSLEFTMSTDFWGVVNGADIELAKFVECGGTIIGIDIPDQDGPNVGDPDGNENVGLINKAVVDFHDIDVQISDDKYWPVINRETVDPVPSDATSQEDLNGVRVTSSNPTDRETERLPKP